MTKNALVTACKLACRISGDFLNDEISELIDSAFYDLEISGVANVEGLPYTAENSDALVLTAVKTYVKINLGDLINSSDMLEKLSKSYDNQKAQLKMRNWSSSKIQGGES